MTPIPNTFALPARARRLVEISSEDQLSRLIPALRGEKVLTVGAGSNLVFLADWPGTVLHSAITDLSVSPDGLIRAGSGIVMDHLVVHAASLGLWGLENLSGIPGEVGASAVQNVGAYGVEAADCIELVEAIDLVTGERRIFTNDECCFGYRDSIFKHPPVKGRYFITHVSYRLSPIAAPVLSYPALREAFADRAPGSAMEIRQAILRIRDEKLPDPSGVPSAGSFFKNPVVSAERFERVKALHPDLRVPGYTLPDGTVKIPAAFLIEQCGWKGFDNGRVAVWHKQPLVLTNPRREATGADILDIEQRIITSVEERYGITLSPEAEHINPS